MMEPRTLRRPVMHFDVGPGLSHVTFDDGKVLRRSLPWGAFGEARWAHAKPEVVEVEIGGWLVEIHGHNLNPLFAAIEERTLLRARARPELERDADHKQDTYATEILFWRSVAAPVRRRQGRKGINLCV